MQMGLAMAAQFNPLQMQQTGPIAIHAHGSAAASSGSQACTSALRSSLRVFKLSHQERQGCMRRRFRVCFAWAPASPRRAARGSSHPDGLDDQRPRRRIGPTCAAHFLSIGMTLSGAVGVLS